MCASFVALAVIGYLDRGMTGAVQTLAVGVVAWLAARLMVHRWFDRTPGPIDR